MTIVDQIKKIASMVGVTATGSTIYEALDTFEKGLKETQEKEAAKPVSTTFDRPNERYQGKKPRKAPANDRKN